MLDLSFKHDQLLLENVDFGRNITIFCSTSCINAYVQYIVDYKDKETT